MDSGDDNTPFESHPNHHHLFVLAWDGLLFGAMKVVGGVGRERLEGARRARIAVPRDPRTVDGGDNSTQVEPHLCQHLSFCSTLTCLCKSPVWGWLIERQEDILDRGTASSCAVRTRTDYLRRSYRGLALHELSTLLLPQPDHEATALPACCKQHPGIHVPTATSTTYRTFLRENGYTADGSRTPVEDFSGAWLTPPAFCPVDMAGQCLIDVERPGVLWRYGPSLKNVLITP
ncbi:uncharacterized protein K452DRAFT_108588 [Aplosporella prunicola CBS 121167]|uniref:Uncharacterized protein n=1 Tax=Aplosporella prunicola CBS 121167 TaxID=1176127 RepID=A0A6A6BQB4_9PEZI|nr:uncharacterized protein K452DRAFT_108588 [Aplosporella prunicola CBS 121167]KAF2146286.1 hypothetical protein K452DRAFT_108588 [Aplosporella prunicola CBS 121167]